MCVRCGGVSVPALRLLAGGCRHPHRTPFVHGLFTVCSIAAQLVEQKVNKARTLPLLLRKHQHDARNHQHDVAAGQASP